MALQLDKELENGVIGNYWKIRAISLIAPDKLIISIDLYLSKAAQLAGKTLLDCSVFSYNDLDVNINNNFDSAYERLKLEEFFSGALDV